MRPSALLAVLPLLATTPLILARPTYDDVPQVRERKSLSFGPVHKHHSFQVIDEPPVAVSALLNEPVDYKDVASTFIAKKVGPEGEAFYIREDSYTDASTGVTRIFAKQLVNGLEVSDGDLNINIDSNGRVLSWGNSFHPGELPNIHDALEGTSGETERTCQILQDTYDAHLDHLSGLKGEEGAWGLVKSAAQVILGGSYSSKDQSTDEHAVKKIHKSMRNVRHHQKALCQQPIRETSSGILSPVEGLLTLLPRIHASNDDFQGVSVMDLTSIPKHNLKPKDAPAEPPTEIISGPGLDKSGVISDVPARLMYTQVSEGAPRLVWNYVVEMKDSWYEAYVDVKTGELLRIVDWATDFDFEPYNTQGHKEVEVKKGGHQKPLPNPHKYEPYSYQVFPWGVNDPSVGNLTVVTKPWDNVASPLGWHKFPSSANPYETPIDGMHVHTNYTVFKTTAGNNVYAHEDWEGRNNFLHNYRPIANDTIFVYDYLEPEGVRPKDYVEMAVTQLFYTSNMYHDLLHRLGFDELSGNFQVYNFEKGGKGGDPVICNAQDGSGYNNANFMTPPDGEAPRMRMYVWDTATPYRDGDLESAIVIHEYSHGLSTRLTGGPANSGCLGWGEAGGMGEGWGDYYATSIRQIEEHKNFKNNSDVYPMGAWAANSAGGIRHYPYTTDMDVNPSTYKFLNKGNYWGVHAIGEVWAAILHHVSQRLVEKHGFGETLFPPEDPSKPNDYYTKTSSESVDAAGRPKPLIPKHGNTLLAQLVLDGMKIQPCRPTFFDARDAIIQADQIRTGGDNYCDLWSAFAERGLGEDARLDGSTPWGGGIRVDGFKLPKKCRKSHFE
ncbi:extracellular elastinolytic metalloproteinase [Kwoniella mangroviensis CBS 10435]|uniref:Extracellular metalloproteinase n=1 Tax=Kwoniella mangroviensis CBS 10435 TaxID=1331196 RepID=A0A1B9ITD4_9TREE|nr:extracellular elastinolytic metalloproteinase [Kwoniella mangroviensis CBS 10435]